MNLAADKLKRLLEQGQEVGKIPRALVVEVLRCFRERYPDHLYALLGDGDATLIIHPPLGRRELAAWRRRCRAEA